MAVFGAAETCEEGEVGIGHLEEGRIEGKGGGGGGGRRRKRRDREGRRRGRREGLVHEGCSSERERERERERGRERERVDDDRERMRRGVSAGVQRRGEQGRDDQVRRV